MVPSAAGWARCLPPAATTALAKTVLEQPAVQRALAARELVVVDPASLDPEERQRRALAADMAAAIRAAEQAEFDRLQRQAAVTFRRQAPADRVRKRRADQWPDARIAELRRLWPVLSPQAVADRLGVSYGATMAQVRRLGLPRKRAV